MMNKKAAVAAFQSFINASLVIALLFFIFSISFGFGGGFKTAFNIGQIVAQVPAWVWVTVAGVWLLSQLRG